VLEDHGGRQQPSGGGREITNSQPPALSLARLPGQRPAAVTTLAAAEHREGEEQQRVLRERARLSSGPMNQNAKDGLTAPSTNGDTTCTATRSCSNPPADTEAAPGGVHRDDDPSRACRLAIAAMLCMMPPANIANGQRISGVTALPYLSACQASRIAVPITNPNRPMIDGAAIGVRNIRLRATQASWSSATARSSSVRRVCPSRAVPYGGPVANLTPLAWYDAPHLVLRLINQTSGKYRDASYWAERAVPPAEIHVAIRHSLPSRG
jgi:hypothetical protein